MRGFGESGGTPSNKLTDEDRARVRRLRPDDIDAGLRYLVSQPGVNRNAIGLGGAGAQGADNSVETARRHATVVKSLVLLSGETLSDGLEFLRHASQLPELFVVADEDEYPPTVEAMELLYVTASSPEKKFVHYSAPREAPWVWYETSDNARVPANGAHGTDLFKGHSELAGIVTDWFVTTLINTPGHAPVDTLAAASTLDQIRMPGGVAKVTQRLKDARRKDSATQLFPEIAVSIIGQDYMRAGKTKLAIETFKLNLKAYPESADANDNLADAYLVDGKKVLARQHAEKALEILASHKVPASSWTDTEPYRGEIRRCTIDTRQARPHGSMRTAKLIASEHRYASFNTAHGSQFYLSIIVSTACASACALGAAMTPQPESNPCYRDFFPCSANFFPCSDLRRLQGSLLKNLVRRRFCAGRTRKVEMGKAYFPC